MAALVPVLADLTFPATDVSGQMSSVLAWAIPVLITVGVVAFAIHLVFKRSAKLG